MKATSLMYHDVVEEGDPDSSGFPAGPPPCTSCPVRPSNGTWKGSRGGRAAPVAAAEGWDSGRCLFSPLTMARQRLKRDCRLLDKYQWRGHFFMTTHCIGPARLLTGDQCAAARRPCDRNPFVSHPTVCPH